MPLTPRMRTPTPRMSTMLPNSVTVGEKNEEPAQGETRPVNGRLADFAVKTDARAFQSQRQFLAVSIEKAFHCYDGHAFALVARGGDCLGGWALKHNGINVYLVAAGISTSAAK